MQRLLCLKQLLSQNPRNLYGASTTGISSTACSKHLLFLFKTNPIHSNTSLLLHPSRHFFSHSSSSSSSSYSRLWVYQKIHGFLSNPILVKLVSLSLLPSNALLKGPPIKALLDCSRVVGFLRPQFSRRSFQLNPSFDYHRRSWQSWLRRFSPDDVVLGLILANVAVFMLWRVADRDFMRKNFMISLDNFRSGRVHTMITSAFSHIEVEHIISNMIGLYFFGTSIARYFGPEFLLKLYLSGAVAGSVFYLVHHAFMSASSEGKRMWSHDPSRTPGLGASGAVNAIMLLDIFLFPRKTLYLEFIIPVPAILLGIFLIGKDTLRVLQGDSHISGSAHLGGAAVAAVAWARLRRGRF
uniref:Rhomboid protein Lonja_PARL n=1 Tax=Lonicera japonica TaxID=105884 RepID=A0A0A7E7Z9_LONJA|nr:rhomboid protein Lonja_PARL [Lonicera japonica]